MERIGLYPGLTSPLQKAGQEGLQKAETPGETFASVMQSAIRGVNGLQSAADETAVSLAKGADVSLHDTMIALEKADVGFQLLMQVRNKVVGAYEEIMRMQV